MIWRNGQCVGCADGAQGRRSASLCIELDICGLVERNVRMRRDLGIIKYLKMYPLVAILKFCQKFEIL